MNLESLNEDEREQISSCFDLQFNILTGYSAQHNFLIVHVKFGKLNSPELESIRMKLITVGLTMEQLIFHEMPEGYNGGEVQ